jgi:DNA modification methylase
MAIFSDVKEQFWFGADYYSTTLGDTMHEGAWIIWDKRLDESADKMYGSCFEMLWSRQKHKRDILRHKWAGIFGTEHEPQRGRMHPNQKPIELYEDILTRYTDKDAVIVDCYAGSGTTLIACERLSRKCRAVEISPAYVAVAIDRWVTMTGGTPELIDSLH